MSRAKKHIISLILMLIILLQGCSFTENTSERIQSNEKIVTEEKIVREDLKIEVADNIQSTYGLMRVHFIDVGQGDCSFIELGNGQTMLIDAGNNENGDEIVDYIEDLQYSDIDYVLATHPHEDHIGGMAEIIENFDIDIFYMPWAVSTSYTYENMLDTLSEKRVEVHKAELGRTILSSGPIEITVLSPEEDTEYSDLNDASAVVRLQYGETVFLFSGDAGENIEEDLCNFDIDSDVLKVGHHGSNSSSSEAFINATSPQIAVISCGQDNMYGHPDYEVLSLLDENNVKVYRTDEAGTIMVTADQKDNITVDKKASAIKENAPPENTLNNNSATENDEVVYITNTGECYHKGTCSYLKSKIETTKAKAQSMGLRACSRCRPPE